MKTIQDILGKDFLDKFKVYHEQTLFPPDFSLLKVRRCPICANRLKIPLNKKIAYCRGRKHRKAFVITYEKFEKLSTL